MKKAEKKEYAVFTDPKKLGWRRTGVFGAQKRNRQG